MDTASASVQFASDLFTLRAFVAPGQLRTIAQLARGEEGQHFIDKAREYASRISTMPKTYEQDGKGEDAIVFLHYFKGSADFYITEKDSDPDGDGQIQAFGLADLFRDGGEMGYISIVELMECGVEMDLFWTPKTLREVRAARGL
jgi:hypothetical protein